MHSYGTINNTTNGDLSKFSSNRELMLLARRSVVTRVALIYHEIIAVLNIAWARVTLAGT